MALSKIVKSENFLPMATRVLAFILAYTGIPVSRTVIFEKIAFDCDVIKSLMHGRFKVISYFFVICKE